jgi:hypothetical protein
MTSMPPRLAGIVRSISSAPPVPLMPSRQDMLADGIDEGAVEVKENGRPAF